MYSIKGIDLELQKIDLDHSLILKISIDKEWSATGMCQLFKSIDILYKSNYWTSLLLQEVSLFISKESNQNITFTNVDQSPLNSFINSIKSNLESISKDEFSSHHYAFGINKKMIFKDYLTVKKIQYASPGVTDFLGIAGIIKEIKELLMYYLPNNHDKQQYEILKEQKTEQRIKNLRAVGLSDIEIRTLILQEDIELEKLYSFINDGHISNVEIVKNTL